MESTSRGRSSAPLEPSRRTGAPGARPPPRRGPAGPRRRSRVSWPVVAGIAVAAVLAAALAIAFTGLAPSLARWVGLDAPAPGSRRAGDASSPGASWRKSARGRKGVGKRPLTMAEALAGVHHERVKAPEEPGARTIFDMERRKVLERVKLALERKDLIGVRDGLREMESKAMITDDVEPLRKALAGSLLVTGEHLEAIEVYKRLLVADSTDHRSKLELGLAYYHDGDLDEALAWAERAAQDQPESPLYEAAVAELRASREEQPALYEAAVAAINERYASRSPDETGDWQEAVAVADALACGGGSTEVAHAYYERARDLFGKQDPLVNAAAEPLWYYVGGEIALAEGRYDDAILSLVSALTTQFKGFAHVGDVYYRVGKAYAGLGDAEKMRANYRLALLNDPYSFRAREMRAALGDPEPTRR